MKFEKEVENQLAQDVEKRLSELRVSVPSDEVNREIEFLEEVKKTHGWQ